MKTLKLWLIAILLPSSALAQEPFKIKCETENTTTSIEYAPSASKKQLYYSTHGETKHTGESYYFDLVSTREQEVLSKMLDINFSARTEFTEGDFHVFYMARVWESGSMVVDQVVLNKDKTKILRATTGEPYTNCISIGIW